MTEIIDEDGVVRFTTSTGLRKPKRPIVIPNAEHLTPEELKKAKHAEAMRRYMNKKRGAKNTLVKQTKQQLRKISNEELVELTKDARNTTLEVMQLKLNSLLKDPEQLAKMNLATLATTYGILFDKTQLMAGLATQNIAVKAKVDINMNPDEAIQELNKMREKFRESNQ